MGDELELLELDGIEGMLEELLDELEGDGMLGELDDELLLLELDGIEGIDDELLWELDWHAAKPIARLPATKIGGSVCKYLFINLLSRLASSNQKVYFACNKATNIRIFTDFRLI